MDALECAGGAEHGEIGAINCLVVALYGADAVMGGVVPDITEGTDRVAGVVKEEGLVPALVVADIAGE